MDGRICDGEEEIPDINLFRPRMTRTSRPRSYNGSTNKMIGIPLSAILRSTLRMTREAGTAQRR
jgi:hypothetical protein